MAKILQYTVILKPAEEGGYIVEVPALEGCMTQGENVEEALEMAKDAIMTYIESLIKLGEPIPEEEHLIQTQINIEVDLLSSKYESKIPVS
ncbi:MAG: type II toxin-antitoxin system HicB family antitoxin [Candidatus Gastranaerophilaceae bacterium]